MKESHKKEGSTGKDGLILDSLDSNVFTQSCTLKGAFSTRKMIKIGTGTTSRKQATKVYWHVIQTGDDEFEIQEINSQGVPSGEKKTISRDSFLEEYHPEIEYFNKVVGPAMAQLRKTIARADRHRKRNESFSAEMEYKNALSIDEESVRATFGLGLVYLARVENEKAQDVFQNLVKLEGAFDPEYKHLFNEFGISLRKNKLSQEAVEYYGRAMEISPDDEHISFNLARAYMEVGDWLECLKSLTMCLESNPDMAAARKMVDYVLKLSENPDLCARHNVPEIGPSLGEKCGEILSRLRDVSVSRDKGSREALAAMKILLLAP